MSWQKGGHADKEIVSIIGKLFLPEAKHLILEHAYKIKNSCANFPIIWSTVGDMLPVKFFVHHRVLQLQRRTQNINFKRCVDYSKKYR